MWKVNVQAPLIAELLGACAAESSRRGRRNRRGSPPCHPGLDPGSTRVKPDAASLMQGTRERSIKVPWPTPPAA